MNEILNSPVLERGRVIEIDKVEKRVFLEILTRLRDKPETEQKFGEVEIPRGWVLPEVTGYKGQEPDPVDHVVLFPPVIGDPEIRDYLALTLDINLSSYDIIIVHDQR